MMIGMNELEILELDPRTGIETRILYYTVPGESFPALVRRVTLTNVAITEASVEIVDGLARFEPFGVNAGMMSNMGRTLEGWMRVYNCAESKGACTLPYFKLSASTADSAQVAMITEGNFALAYVAKGDESTLLPVVVDPDVVFGTDTTLRTPLGFDSVEEMAVRSEVKVSKTPCALSLAKETLAPGASVTVVSVYGHAKTVEELTDTIAPAVLEQGFVSKKYIEAVELTERLTSMVQSTTANALFDAFSRQMMLDNLLRGGFPEFLGDSEKPKVYHTFSRIHGDLERDYNNFQIDSTYYSQGSGNYRDVNQNRRVDVMLFPRLGDFNLRQFLTYKQADGYNPLTVATAFFSLGDDSAELDAKAVALADECAADEASAEKLVEIFKRPFRPGQLFDDARDAKVELKLEPADFLDTACAAAEQVFAANYTHEGFWADHWTYDLDQINSFEAIFPDDVERAMWDAAKLPFYMSSGSVQARDFKYVEVTMHGEKAVRQYFSVYDDPKKVGQLLERNTRPDGAFQLAAQDGKYEQEDTWVYAVSPVSKLFLLCVTKFALLDPSGMGCEMDANKPGWNDAMNGLPGLLGSGMAETAETLRVAQWLLENVQKFGRGFDIPAELGVLVDSITTALGVEESTTDFEYWDAVAGAREEYRAAVHLFFSGEDRSLTAKELIAFLTLCVDKLERGIEKSLAFSPDGTIMPSYFQHEVIEYKKTGILNYVHQPFVKALKFQAKVFPLFLEGPVRQLKVIPRDATARLVAIHDAVKASPLYDAPIAQYKICESLEGQPFEMGRMMAFTPGWLENESIWLHMSFKYYLELLRAGLFEQYWTAMETGAPYNMDVDVYGRSPVECGSFIVSSAYPDKKMWGSSFLARLSGSTAEFLSMWILAMAGAQPFQIIHDELALVLKPALPANLFTQEDIVSFSFLSVVTVNYHNPLKLDTWKTTVVEYELTCQGQVFKVKAAHVGAHLAAKVRAGDCESIDVELA